MGDSRIVLRTSGFAPFAFGSADRARGALLAILGSGGKSGLRDRLGRELAREGFNVILTDITRSAPPTGGEVLLLERDGLRAVREELQRRSPVYVLGREGQGSSLLGVEERELPALAKWADAVLVEADGARRRPIKAHNERDPVVPGVATHALVIVGADAVGATLQSGRIHRPELFARTWGLAPGEELTAAQAAEVVTSERGYAGKLRAGVRTAFLVNRGDLFAEEAQELAEQIARRTSCNVAWGSVAEGWHVKVRQNSEEDDGS